MFVSSWCLEQTPSCIFTAVKTTLYRLLVFMKISVKFLMGDIGRIISKWRYIYYYWLSLNVLILYYSRRKLLLSFQILDIIFVNFFKLMRVSYSSYYILKCKITLCSSCFQGVERCKRPFRFRIPKPTILTGGYHRSFLMCFI